MITAWIRLDRRPRGLGLSEWDRRAELPEEVSARYATEIGPPLLLWSTGELAGGIQGSKWNAWPVADYPRAAIHGHQGKGSGVALRARARRDEERPFRLEHRSIAVVSCPHFDETVLDWLVEHRALFVPLFPEGVDVEETTEDYG